MPPSVPDFFRLVGLTLVNPADVARLIVAHRQSRQVLWSALLLVTVLTVLMLAAVQMVVPAFPVPQPFTSTLVVGAMFVILVFAIYFTGQALGGTGTFPAAIALVAWYGAVGIVVRTVVALVIGMVPALAVTLGLASGTLMLWCLVNFVNVLHGYDSLPKAAGVLALTLIGLLFGVAFIVALIGIGATTGAT